ncbi:MAG: hypothetical protein ACR2F2_10725 [Pyrinomonadaceae bacterium]
MTNYKRGDVILALFPDSNLLTAPKSVRFSSSKLTICKRICW